MNLDRIVLPASLMLVAITLPVALAGDAAQPAPKKDPADRPLVAVWRDSDGFVSESEAPYLRVAIWGDGRVLFAKDPARWGHELQAGRIPKYRVERLKAALRSTGVFDLKGHCYLGPDLPVDCITVDLGDRNGRQTLYWVEGLTDWMTKPHQKDFLRAWTAVNHLALVACPDQFKPAKERFEWPPKWWYLKEMIQSE